MSKNYLDIFTQISQSFIQNNYKDNPSLFIQIIIYIVLETLIKTKYVFVKTII